MLLAPTSSYDNQITGNVTRVVVTGTTILVPYPKVNKVKLLQLIWKERGLVDSIYVYPIFR